MGALFYGFAIFNINNSMSVSDGRKSMGHHQGCSTLAGLVQRRLYQLLGMVIQCGGGLIQKQDFGLLNQSSGDGNTLTLASRKLNALLADVGIITLKVD